MQPAPPSGAWTAPLQSAAPEEPIPMFASIALRAAAIAVLAASAAFAQEGEEDAPDFPTTEFADGAITAEVSEGDITARIVMEKVPGDDPTLDFPVLHVLVNGAEVLSAVGAGSDLDYPATEASIAEIDPANDTREVYFTSYSGGAHCCSRVIVATKAGDGWKAVDVGEFDSDGDYLEDADGDGRAEIVLADNRFLYRFDCYACSAAPLRILGIDGGKVVDLSTEPRFHETHRRWLEDLEDGTDAIRRWQSPGFLAGWVATRVRLGEGKEAWDELLANWDLAKDRGAAACTTGADIEKCPRKNRKVLKFPDRLKIFLDANGYAF
jgi:hypothetical protein